MKIIAISGPSCSGKSTFARHLRLVLSNASILYQDDFYKPESMLPLNKNGQSNWDVPESFDLEKMRASLLQIKQSNSLPNQLTREDFNNVSEPLLDESIISQLKIEFSQFTEPVLIVDGILLFQKNNNLDDLFDFKILMPFDYLLLKSRREARSGYTTSDGQWWQDPPEFFENTVWPEFIKYYGWLYNNEGTSYILSQKARNCNLWMPNSSDMTEMIRSLMKNFKELK